MIKNASVAVLGAYVIMAGFAFSGARATADQRPLLVAAKEGGGKEKGGGREPAGEKGSGSSGGGKGQKTDGAGSKDKQ